MTLRLVVQERKTFSVFFFTKRLKNMSKSLSLHSNEGHMKTVTSKTVKFHLNVSFQNDSFIVENKI